MNRKDFLRKLGIGIGIAAVAPSVLSKGLEEETKPTGYLCAPNPADLNPAAIVKEWKQNGNLLYNLGSHYCINDVIYMNNELFLVVAVDRMGNSTYEYTLRPFENKPDIDITPKRLVVEGAVLAGNVYKGWYD